MSAPSCSGSRACHAISATVIDVVQALIRDRAIDGRVEVADLERMLSLVRRGTMSMDAAFLAQEERCRKDHSRPKGNVGARSNPFQRLMVRPFEHLLFGNPPPFPRPLLANYFTFIEQALEPERDAWEKVCRAVIQALLVVHGNNLTWDHFYSDQRALKTLGTALTRIARLLSTHDGARHWQEIMGRPLVDHPSATLEQVALVRQALLETQRGLNVA
ncbi:hypothetical protein [Magnetospirillum moscoviense]|nr:hypothetical protein [Magnetospirillum moscoviense]